MKTRNRASLIAFSLLAVLVTACGGDSKSSPATTKATNPPVVTTVADPTTTPAPPTTVKETTTTEAVDYSYDLSGIVLEYTADIYVGPIPGGAQLPFDARNPEFEKAATLGELVDLPSGSPKENEVCIHLPDETSYTAGFDHVGLESNYNGGSPITLVMVYVTEQGANISYTADSLGVIPSEDGTTWVEGLYMSIGAIGAC